MATAEEATQRFLDLAEGFREALNTFISKREPAIQMLKDKVEMLNSCRKTANITKITGSSVGIAAAIAGVASIPLTGGLSLLALGVGAILGVSGGAAVLGGDIYVSVREKELMDETKTILDADLTEAKKLIQSAAALKAYVEYMAGLGIPLDFALTHVGNLADFAGEMNLERYAKPGLEIIQSLRELGKLGKLARLGKIAEATATTSVFLSVLFVPVDIIQILSSSSELSKDNSVKATIVQHAIEALESDLVKKKALATQLSN